MRRDNTGLLTEAALRAGLRSCLVANRILTVESGTQEPLAFARGVPPSTRQGGAALLEERDVARSVLAGSGIPVPMCQTFTFDAPMADVERAAAQFGAGSGVRSAWQGGPIITPESSADVRGAVERIEGVVGTNSRRTARPQSRFMVEEPLREFDEDVVVSHGRLLGTPPGLSGPAEALAVGAIGSIPGVKVGSVRLAERIRDGALVVSSVSAVPRLRGPDRTASTRAWRLLSDEVGYFWKFEPRSPESDALAARLEVGGVTSEGLEPGIRVETGTGSTLAVDSVQSSSAGLLMEVEGNAPAVTELMNRLITGSLVGAVPLWVEAVVLGR